VTRPNRTQIAGELPGSAVVKQSEIGLDVAMQKRGQHREHVAALLSLLI
jgi:hypothetical protein